MELHKICTTTPDVRKEVVIPGVTGQDIVRVDRKLRQPEDTVAAVMHVVPRSSRNTEDARIHGTRASHVLVRV